ncbi:MAG: TatD family hydrolase [Mollicutes bacterium]|nr:TatD family hydrolase [Mollicutes bacterium]
MKSSLDSVWGNEMNFVDSHCHLNDERFKDNVDEVVASSFKAGVTTILVVGYDLESSLKAIEIASRHEGVYAAIGFHPENLENVSDDNLNKIKELCKNPKVIAIGEIGLDYHWYKEQKDRDNQKIWFIKQLKMADELDLPVSIHCREAVQDTFDILKEYTPQAKGVLHCYSGSVEMMKEFEKLGYYFGFDGPITYKNSIVPKQCVKEVSIDRILSETDCPYLPPVPFRGQTNYPEYIPYIVRQMSEIKEISLDILSKKIQDNFNKLFHVKL